MFQPDDLTSSVTFSTVDDEIPEPDEEFTVTLQSTSDEVVIGDQSSAVVTITANDDAAGILSFEVGSHALIYMLVYVGFMISAICGRYTSK